MSSPRPRRLTAKDVCEIRARLAAGESVGSVARAYNYHPANLAKIRDGRIWKDTDPRVAVVFRGRRMVLSIEEVADLLAQFGREAARLRDELGSGGPS